MPTRTPDHDRRLPLALPYGTELTAAIAALVNLATNPTFQRELTARVSTRADYADLGVLRVMSFTGLCRPAALAAEVGVSRPQASKALALLEAAGLVVRERSADDGRGVEVAFTADGRAVAQGLYDVGDQFFAEITAGWSADDVATLARLVSRFVRDGRDAVERLHADER
ncbi:MAG: MarR family transcriptional regulator [Micrococcales bacterium]|nr:MarR family transcriptional regulator [Micrococcales bacterium]